MIKHCVFSISSLWTFPIVIIYQNVVGMLSQVCDLSADVCASDLTFPIVIIYQNVVGMLSQVLVIIIY